MEEELMAKHEEQIVNFHLSLEVGLVRNE